MDQRKRKSMRNQWAVKLGRIGGRIGGRARAAALSSEERSRIARNAALVRWSRTSPEERRDIMRKAALKRWGIWRKKKASSNH